MRDEDFNRLLGDMRPRLHRYCARMTGSAIDGEDVVQDVFVKALTARSGEARIDNPQAWLFRIAHNATLDFLRKRSRSEIAQPDVLDMAAASETDTPDHEVVAVSFGTFMRLPVLQRCAVILKDVLGHSVEEIAIIAECSVPAAKSALQRGRARLKVLVQEKDEDVRLPLLSDEDRDRLVKYVEMFRSGEFDAVRHMLADDVKLDLVARLKLQGKDDVDQYFTRYAQATNWQFAAGSVDGRPVMLVYDKNGRMHTPAHFVVLDWHAGRIAGITDFLFAPYALEGADWLVLI